MELNNLAAVLQNNTYPGRGILLGKTPDGKHGVVAYFIMGRSENSRNRVFVEDGQGIRTQAFDESKLTDPSLIIYAPVRVLGTHTIVTNGDQTDTIYNGLNQGKSFAEALRTRTFEPDAPNFTPRISGVLTIQNGLQYRLSILKSNHGNPESVLRYFYEYPQPVNGQGHLIHTYRYDGNPIPSFVGEPLAVTVENDLNTLTQTLWTSLNAGNKVALFVRFIDLRSGETKTNIINKHS